MRGADPAARSASSPALELLDPVHQRADLPVGQPGHRLADRPGQVDGRVEVDQPRVDQPVERRDGLASASVNARSPPCSGKPSARHSRRASVDASRRPPRPPRAALKPGLLAQDRVLERLAERPVGSLRSPSVRSAAVVELMQHSLSRAGRPRPAGCRAASTRPWVLASLMIEGAAAEHPVDESDLVGHVADPRQRDVVAAAGQDAGAGDQPPVGDRVARRQPLQERPQHEPGPSSRATTNPIHRVALPDVLRLPRTPRRPAQTGQHQRQQERLGVRAGADYDGLAVVEIFWGDRHPGIMSLIGAFLSDLRPRTCTTSPASTVATPARSRPPAARRRRRSRPFPSGPRPRAAPRAPAARRSGRQPVYAARSAARRPPPASRRTPGRGRAAPRPAARCGRPRRRFDRQRGGGRTGSSPTDWDDVDPDAEHRGRARRASRSARPAARRACGRPPARRWATSARRAAALATAAPATA